MVQDKIQEQLLKARREAEERDAQRKAEKSGFGYISLPNVPVQVDALKIVKEEEARRLKVAPFQFKNNVMDLAAINPEDDEARHLIKNLEKKSIKVKVFVVSRITLDHIWSFYKFVPKEVPEITGRIDIERKIFDQYIEKLTSLEKVKKEVLETERLLEVVLAGALANRASDIHLEPSEKSVTLRYRVDGLLHDVVDKIKPEIYEALTDKIKLFAHLKLNIHDEPQDGRFTIGVGAKEIEIRVSVVPAEFGEVIVMRVLDPSAIALDLPALGLREDDLAIIENQLKEPNGMLLNTGPTGSGKTTTLYSFLLKKKKPEIKIITIEDPIEYHIEGIEQTQVDPDTGYDFANGLQSLMRQDPDIIFVGEIRDSKTATIAIQAALTGHLVFSTVHANSAAGAIPRLLDLEVRPASIGPAMNLIIAQRLVRSLCVKCKVPQKAGKDMEVKIKKFLNNLPERVDRTDYQEIKLYAHKGCGECNNLGYKGRVAIFELMEVGDEMEKIINEKVGEVDVYKQSLKQGMVTMQQDGILKVISGITSFEEVESVTGTLEI